MGLPPQTTLEFAMWRDREPVISILLGTDAVVIAALTAANAVGVLSLDGSQLASISAAVVAITSFAAAIVRALVVSPATNHQQVLDALYSPIPESDV